MPDAATGDRRNKEKGEPSVAGRAKVGYDKYVRFIVAYLAILFVAVTIFLRLGQAL